LETKTSLGLLIRFAKPVLNAYDSGQNREKKNLNFGVPMVWSEQKTTMTIVSLVC